MYSDIDIERIQYLTKKAQLGVTTIEEQAELANILGLRPEDFQEPNGINNLIVLALVVIAVMIIVRLLR